MRGVGGKSPEGEYERYRGVVLGMLAKRFSRIAEDERLAIYHDAWARVLAKRERGEKIDSLRAYLLATTGAEALNLLTRGRIPTPIGPDDPRLEQLADGAPPLDEQIVTRDQARIARGLLDTLDARQRDVLKLRWDLQLSGSEVRSALGLSERQYRRLAEEGASALAARVEELDSGQWSRRTRSLLVACLVEVTRDGKRQVGIASRRQREEAQRLLDSDPHVAALYAEIRRSVRGAAALLPLPLFLPDAWHGSPAQLLADLRGQMADAIETVRQHSTSLYVRAADPTLLTTPRPGAAVMAVTGALALGGGAYGAHEVATHERSPESTGPTQAAVEAPAPIGQAATASKHRSAKSPARQPFAPQPRTRDSPAQEATPPTQAPPAPRPAQPTTPIQPTPTVPTTEFGFED